jgi:hypothetical protein
MTAFGCGRDDLPATEDSLPSHSPSRDRPLPSGIKLIEADGRAADEAAARRKLRACPLANAKAACFESAHRNQGSSDLRNRTGGTPDLRVQDRPGRKRDFGSRAATGSEGASASEGSGRTGLRLGSCEPGRDPGLTLMDLSGGTRASALDPAGRGTKGFGRRNRQSGKRSFGFESAKRRTARASALTGSLRGNPKRLRPWRDSGGCGALAGLFGASAWLPPLETARRGMPCFGKAEREGTVGAGSDVGPHYFGGDGGRCEHAAGQCPHWAESRNCSPRPWSHPGESRDP